MKKFLLLSFTALAFVGCKNDQKENEIDSEEISEEVIMRKADSLAQALIIVDGHVDLPYRLKEEGVNRITAENGAQIIDQGEGDFDFERAKEGGLDAPFMSVYIPAELQEKGGAKAFADSIIDLVKSIPEAYPERFALATSPEEVKQNFEAGKISLPMGMENGAPIEDDLKNVAYYFDKGIRYITLTHSKDNLISDSSYDTTATHQGLSPFGREVVQEMNRVGIMVDVSHITDSAFYDVMEITKVPVVATHSSSRKFTPGFERNMSDDLIKRLAENGGVIMINFGSDFLDSASQESGNKLERELEAKGLSPEDEDAKSIIAANPYQFSDVSKVADHIDHVVEIAGIDHVGLGSDYDGVGDSLPEGLKDVSQFPNLFAELLRRGYSEEDIAKIAYQNIFRVWNAALDAREI